MLTIRTGSWFTQLPDDHARIGISRGIPHRQAPGFRVFRKLAPGSWFNSVGVDEYRARYQAEVLDRLDPHQIARELEQLAGGRIPTLLCFERAGGPKWCHRSLAAAWLAEALGLPVPEFGFEDRPQDQHPLLPGRTLLL